MLAYKYYPSAEESRESTPLIMLHGFLCSGQFFSENISEIRHHCPVYTFDLPGYGLSIDCPYQSTIEAMAQDVIATIDALKIENFHILGHSMGGMVALVVSILETMRVKKLILYATNSQGNEKERFETYQQSKQRLQDNYQIAKEGIVATWFMQGKKHPKYNPLMELSRHVELDTALASLDAMSCFNTPQQDIDAITAKTLIIGAQFDKTYTEKTLNFLRSQLPEANFSLIKGVAHNAHLENPKEFNDQVTCFICKGLSF